MLNQMTVAVMGIKVFEADCRCGATQVAPREFSSLTYRLSGRITLSNERLTVESAENTITYVPRGVGYYTEVPVPGHMIGIHFDSNETGDTIPEVFIPNDPITYRNRFFTILRTYGRAEAQSVYTVLSQFYALIADLAQSTAGQKDTDGYEKIRAACDYLCSHLSDSSLSVARLAAVAEMSEVYFRRLFLQTHGVPPSVYIKQKRLDNAKALLETGYYRVSEVAFRCGFQDAGYFAYEFRRAEGITPSEFASGRLLRR